MTDEEVMAEAVAIARAVTEGDVAPLAGAARIWVISSENNRACSGELRGFIAAASQVDEVPAEVRVELVEDARRAAAALVAKHSAH